MQNGSAEEEEGGLNVQIIGPWALKKCPGYLEITAYFLNITKQAQLKLYYQELSPKHKNFAKQS